MGLDWLEMALRFMHVIAAIAWIGDSFYFMWLDATLEAPEPPREGVEGALWMVHSGGFYQVEKRRVGPGSMPPVLHWFKWEATFTWLSGLTLLTVLYFLGADVYMVPPGSTLTPIMAVGLGVGTLVAGWFVYDLLWRSPLGNNTLVGASVSFVLLVAAAFGLCHVLTGRAAFILVGATLGTSMLINVWVHILPAQRKMIASTERGETPDYELGRKAKKRSTHNSYMTLPVLFMMISNHYPNAYGNDLNWVILALLVIVGVGVRHMMILRVKHERGAWVLAPIAVAVAGLLALTWPHTEASAAVEGPHVTFAQANDIIIRRCRRCHSATPTDDVFKVAPNGISFDSPATIKALAPRIKLRAVVSKTMPLANKTHITEEERETLGRWIDEGAPLQ